jgi:hypothetical protein
MDQQVWEVFRRPDGTINLAEVYKVKFGRAPSRRASLYLRDIEEMLPIKSRQAAAVALATARHLANLEGVVSSYVE